MRQRLLVIDDDAACAEGVAELLRIRLPEAEVEIQTDPIAALRQILDGNYQVVITDVQMPRLDGLMLLAALHGVRPELPVILMTGTPEVTARQVPAAKAVLSKPIDRERLMQILRATLESQVSGPGAKEGGGAIHLTDHRDIERTRNRLAYRLMC